MDRNLLYKIPKDVLVELVCKNFKNMSIEDLGEIYKNKCLRVIRDYKKLLKEHHYVDSFFTYTIREETFLSKVKTSLLL